MILLFLRFWHCLRPSGGCRTLLSLNARKSKPSLKEPRAVVSFALLNSAVLALEVKVDAQGRLIQVESPMQISSRELHQREAYSDHMRSTGHELLRSDLLLDYRCREGGFPCQKISDASLIIQELA